MSFIYQHFNRVQGRYPISPCVLLLQICRECFYEVFEEEIHQVIVKNQLFRPGERIAVGASGGKGGYRFFLIVFHS